jgi:hypothetical protein
LGAGTGHGACLNLHPQADSWQTEAGAADIFARSLIETGGRFRPLSVPSEVISNFRLAKVSPRPYLE